LDKQEAELTSLYEEAKRVCELNLRLMDTLQATVTWIIQYAEATGTIVPRIGALHRLMREAARLADEIDLPLVPRHDFVKSLKGRSPPGNAIECL
jgi:hypothetical protein